MTTQDHQEDTAAAESFEIVNDLLTLFVGLDAEHRDGSVC